MLGTTRGEWVARCGFVAILTALSMYFGHALRAPGADGAESIVSPVWPATGVNIALLLLFGIRTWPGVLAGSLACNLLVFYPDWRVTVAGSPADVVEAVTAVWLMHRLTAGLTRSMATRRAVLSLMAAGCIGPLAGIIVGAFLFWALGMTIVFPDGAWRPLANWAIADALSAITIVPVVITWSHHIPVPWTKRPKLQAWILAISLTIVAGAIFAMPVRDQRVHTEALVFVTLPFIVWAALAFAAFGAAHAMLWLTIIGVAGTIARRGPFAGTPPEDSVLMLQIYLGVTTAMSLLLGASTCARSAAHLELERSNAHVRMLLHELDHRVRNHLASLIGMIDATQGSARDVSGYAKALRTRVHSMARTHHLTRGAEDGRVPIRDVVLGVVPEDAHDKLDLSHTPLDLTSKVAASLGMIIAEFVSNSEKHGVLAADDGSIRVTWREVPWARDPDSHAGAEQTPDVEYRGVSFQWIELAHNIEPANQTPLPIIEGVGLRLVRGITESELRGRATLGATTAGAAHTIEFPFDPDGRGFKTRSPMLEVSLTNDLRPVQVRDEQTVAN